MHENCSIVSRKTWVLAAGAVWFGATIKRWGWPGFIPLKDLNDSKKGFIVEDGIMVEAKVTVLAELVQEDLAC